MESKKFKIVTKGLTKVILLLLLLFFNKRSSAQMSEQPRTIYKYIKN